MATVPTGARTTRFAAVPPALSHPLVDPDAGYVHRVLAAHRGSDDVVLRTPYGAVTGEQLCARVARAVAALAEHGVGPGSMVGLLTAPAHPIMVWARYAAHWLGAAVVHLRSMNPRSDGDELPIAAQREVLEQVGANVLVVDEECLGRGRLLTEGSGRRLVTDLDGHGVVPPPATPGREEWAVVDFTSGTTNAPRLVAQTCGARERLVARLESDAGGPGSTLLSVTPISHTTAPMIDATLARGGSVVVHESFDADAVLTAFADGVTDVYLATPHLYELVAHPGIGAVDAGRLRRVIYSGTPAAPGRAAEAIRIFGPALVQVYGTTETGGISALSPDDHAEPLLRGTVGRPFPWVQVELRSAETGAVLDGPGRIGEVWVCSDTVSAGYVGDHALTAAHWQDDWVRSGDLGAFDEHGYLRLVGRVGGVIKHAGLKIYPASVEQALLTHPAVKEAVVQAARDRDRREHVHAVVVLRSGASAEPEELRQHVASRLSPAHAPSRIVFWSGIPLTRSGKPNQGLIRQLMGA